MRNQRLESTRRCVGLQTIAALAWVSLSVALAACGIGSEREARAQITRSAREPRPASTASAPVRHPTARTSSTSSSPRADPSTTTAPTAAAPVFDTPFPLEACPAAFRVALAHRDAPALAPALAHAIAFRSEDGRRLHVAISDQTIVPMADGRLPPVADNGARLEWEAVRYRTRALSPGPLGRPDERGGALTHVRIVTAHSWLTFGLRARREIELTEVGPTRVCGRIDLDDGFGRVRGAFTAPVVGTIPQ